MYEREAELKRATAATQECCDTTNAGKIGYGLDEACRPSLAERVTTQISRARREARQLDRLSELRYLLEKNPEVARILDLMESLKD